MSSRRRQCKDDRLPRVVATRCIRCGYHRRHRGPVVVRVNDVLRRRTTSNLPRRPPPRWRMTTTTTTTTTTVARGVLRPPRRLDHRGGGGQTSPPPSPDRRPFAPTLTVVLSFPRGCPVRIIPAPGEVERRSPPREGVGAVVQGRPLPPLALLFLARRRPRSPSASPIFSSAVATASSSLTIASPPPSPNVSLGGGG
jgi:hypothetical protein